MRGLGEEVECKGIVFGILAAKNEFDRGVGKHGVGG